MYSAVTALSRGLEDLNDDFRTTASSKVPSLTAPAMNSSALEKLLPYPLSWSQKQDEKEDLEMALLRFQSLLTMSALYSESLAQHKKYCKENELSTDKYALSAIDRLELSVKELACAHQHKLEQVIDFPIEHQQRMIEIDQIYRALLNLQVPLARLLSWTAQTYRSSKVPQFFHGAKTKKEAVNYDRVQSARINLIEKQFKKLYGFDDKAVAVLMTCSGTAAYSVLEKYLTIHVLKPGDKVLVAPTMYDEHQDWAFRANPEIELITEELFDTDQIIECIERVAPKVVFIDPLKNRQDARLTDVSEILRKLSKSWVGDDLYFIIDDTMLAAAIDPFAIVASNPRLKILLCSSCGKYLEIGQDTCMAGLLAYPMEMSKRMKNIRMFHGSIISDTAAWSYPNFDREFYTWRMRRMTRNALIFTEILSQNEELLQYLKPVFSALPDHPDSAKAHLFPYLGGVVNLRLIPQVENPKENLHDILDEMIISVIEQAKYDDSSVGWGEAVGFSIPRISVHLEWMWRVPPYLRLVAGDRSIVETIGAARSIAAGLLSYINGNRNKFFFDLTEEEKRAKGCGIESISVENLEREDMSFFR